MLYTVKVEFAQEEPSDEEKDMLIKQFQKAFVAAAVSYYSKNSKKSKNLT